MENMSCELDDHTYDAKVICVPDCNSKYFEVLACVTENKCSAEMVS